MDRQALRKACCAATKKKDNAAFHLMYNLMGHVFTEEMARSRGTGLERSDHGEKYKPLFDGEKLTKLKGKFINFPAGILAEKKDF